VLEETTESTDSDSGSEGDDIGVAEDPDGLAAVDPELDRAVPHVPVALVSMSGATVSRILRNLEGPGRRALAAARDAKLLGAAEAASAEGSSEGEDSSSS
jgi:hypothetical protein